MTEYNLCIGWTNLNLFIKPSNDNKYRVLIYNVPYKFMVVRFVINSAPYWEDVEIISVHDNYLAACRVKKKVCCLGGQYVVPFM